MLPGMRAFAGLRVVAFFEAAKGLLVLLAGFGLLQLLHRDAQHIAEELLQHFHLNPAHRHTRIFLHLVQDVTSPHLLLLAAGAFAYAAVRFLEAYGLWRERRWAEWVAVLSSGIYLPIEIWELTRTRAWPVVSLFLLNVLIVVYLARTLVRTRGHPAVRAK
jgi:uncharacterized membrane protein (DUF2068 family)